LIFWLNKEEKSSLDFRGLTLDLFIDLTYEASNCIFPSTIDMSSSASPTTHGVAEISAHEAAEHSRIQVKKTSFSTKEAAEKKRYAEDVKRIEAEERATASAELQKFGAEEIPQILQAGEAAREKAVADVDKHARATMSSELKTIVTKACSYYLSF
jgi:hypothetical protein